MKRLALLLLALTVLLSAVVLVRAARFTSRQITAPPGIKLDFDRAAALERLSRAIQIRTVSSPDPAQMPIGEFERFHEFLIQAFPQVAKRLDREIVGGQSLLYTWNGQDSTARPILLMAHMDVVPANEQGWRYAPFSGALAEGYVWGRGTLDDKASVMALLESVERLLTHGFSPKRSIYLAFGHDEEVGGHGGAAKIAELLQARGVALDFVLDEGMNILDGIVPGLSSPVALIGIAEKGYLSLRLRAEASGGHSSMPPADSAITIISRALQTLAAKSFRSRLTVPTRQMLEFLGPEMSWTNRIALANLWLLDPLVRWQLARSHITDAAIRTTVAPTVFQAGFAENVMPTSAAVVINLRLLPGDTIASAIEHVRRVIAEPKIQITALPVQMEPSAASDIRSPAFDLTQRTIRQTAPSVIVAPALLVSATDSRHYAALTKNIFRFLPITLGPDDVKRYHGIDERISMDDYERCIRFYAQLIRNFGEQQTGIGHQ
jgi:carboxypeptidase PM20D1